MSEWNTFEFMDRAATVELLIAELLTDHPVSKNPDLAAKLTALEEAAGALYRAAATHHHTLTPAKPEQVEQPDPTLAATVKRLEERVATVEAMNAANYKVASELRRDLEAAPTPAKVRVVAPTLPVYINADCNAVLTLVDRRWRAALAAAGVEVKEASNGKA